MTGLYYNEILEKLKILSGKPGDHISKEEKLRKILEKFEKEHDILISGIFNEDGLEIVTGFQREYVDEEKLGAYGCKLCDAGLEFMIKVLAEPLTSKTLHEVLKTNLCNRKTNLKCIVLESTVERINPHTSQTEQFFTPIIVSPIEQVGYIIMIIEHRENLALIKMNLDYLKDLICNILL